VDGAELMGDEAIHAAHCSAFWCVYGDPNCPVVEVEPGQIRGGAEAALAVLREKPEPDPCQPLSPICETCGFRHPEQVTALTEEFLVRNAVTGWVYALPKVLPKFLDGQRGTEECARWHLRQIAGPDPEDWTGFEIVKRPVGAWEVVG
jgi:hypothetical protein